MWVKGQERLIRKVIQDVRITVENYPENMVLPDPWIPPTTTCAISGPRNIVEFLYSDQCSFRIDVSKYNLPEGDTGLPVNLTNDMFVTRLNTEEQNRISVLDKQISPSQVLLKVIPEYRYGTSEHAGNQSGVEPAGHSVFPPAKEY